MERKLEDLHFVARVSVDVTCRETGKNFMKHYGTEYHASTTPETHMLVEKVLKKVICEKHEV